MRFAPLALLVAGLASAQKTEIAPATSGNLSGSGSSAVGTNGASTSGSFSNSGLSGANVTGSLSGSVSPNLTPGVIGGNSAIVAGQNGGVVVKGVVPGGTVAPSKGGIVAGKTDGTGIVGVTAGRGIIDVKGAKTQPVSNVGANVNAKGFTPGASMERPAEDGTPGAKTILDGAASGIELGRKNEAAGVEGLSVRQALDRAYDASLKGGDVKAAPNGVAGRFQSTKEHLAEMLSIANTAPPANSPELYEAVKKKAEAELPPSVAAAIAKTVRGFASHKADLSLTELAQAAFGAAASGQASETTRLVKALDKWESLLGAPGAPLISNGAALKAAVTAALEAAKAGEKKSPPRVYLEKKGASYSAVLPGVAGASSVAKVPAGLSLSFALKPETALESPFASAYRGFLQKPGAGAVYRARKALGDSVASAAFSATTYWLKALLARIRLFLRSLLPGRSIPSVASAENMPKLKAAAKAWTDAAVLGDAASRAASAPRLTVAKARGAFALALKSAAAHEVLTGESGAVATVEKLASSFEGGVTAAGLTAADVLTPGLQSLVAGDGGLAHWASRHAADAREKGAQAFAKVKGRSAVVVLEAGPAETAAKTLAAAGKGLGVVAYGSTLWARGDGVVLSADLRSTEAGGSVVIELASADERLARKLDELGFNVTRAGAGLKAVYDADAASGGANEVAAMAADGAAAATGADVRPTPSFGGLQRLLADVKTSKGDAVEAAKALDGGSWLLKGRPLALVGDLRAYSVDIPADGGKVTVTALQDPDTGLVQYARAERAGKLVPPAAFAELLRPR